MIVKHGKRIKVVRTLSRPLPGSHPNPKTYVLDTPYDGVLTANIDYAPPSATLGVYDAAAVTPIGPVGVTSLSFTRRRANRPKSRVTCGLSR
jgi:hypothetical protein